MAMDVEPSRGETIRLMGRHSKWANPAKRADLAKWAVLASVGTDLVLLAIVMLIGFATWGMLSGSSDAEGERDTVPLAVMAAQHASPSDPVSRPTGATLVAPAEEAVPARAVPVDGLRISWQTWRRGGLGSNAQVTFTLRNGNDYAVKDIEISCAFARRDGSHLTDRTRTIHDTVNMKSRRTFARLHVGFVNINANKAKCSLIAADRI